MQGVSPTPCEADQDCPASLVCYQRTLSWTNNQSFCLCSTWYGWTRSSESSTHCDLSPFAVFAVVFFAIMSAILVMHLVVLIRMMRHFKSKEDLRQNASFATTLVFTCCWTVSAAVRSALLAKEFAAPEAHVLLPFGPGWKFSSFGLFMTRPLLVVTIMFSILVDLQFIMVWFNVAVQSSRASSGRQSHEGARRYQNSLRVVVIVFEVIFLIGASILVAQDSLSNFLYFCMAFFAIILLSYAITGYRLYSLFNDAMANEATMPNEASAKLRGVAQRIKVTATANSILVLLSFATSLVAAETNKVFKEMGLIPAGCQLISVLISVCQILVATIYLSSALVSSPTRRNDQHWKMMMCYCMRIQERKKRSSSVRDAPPTQEKEKPGAVREGEHAQGRTMDEDVVVPV